MIYGYSRYDIACVLLVIALLIIVFLLAAGAFLFLGGASL
jgi:hypothetical protein